MYNSSDSSVYFPNSGCNSFITSASLVSRTISFASTSFSKVYGDVFTVSATASAGSGTVTYSAGSSTSCSISGTTVTMTSYTGTCSISASVASDGTYALANTTVSATSSTGVKPLTISGVSASAKTYNNSTAATISGTAALSSVVSGDTATAISLNIASAIGTFDTKTAGSRTVTFSGYALSGTKSSYYSLTQPSSVSSIVISKATPGITWSPTTQIYPGVAMSNAEQFNASNSNSLPGTYTYFYTDTPTTTVTSSTTLTAGTYSFKARFTPTDSTNYNSETSTAVNITMLGATAPVALAKPTLTKGVADSSLVVTFTALANTPSQTGGSAITGYQYKYVYLENSAPSDWIGTNDTSTSRIITGLARGKAYTVVVRAVNAQGEGPESPVSDSATATGSLVTTLAAPTAVSVASGDSQLTISFTVPNVPDISSAITSYQYSLDGGLNWMSSATGSPIVAAGLVNGKTDYSIRVRVMNAGGAGASSSSFTGNATPATNPLPPTSVALTQTSGSIAVQFVTPTNSGGGALSYQYRIKPSSSGTWGSWTNTPTVTVSGLNSSFTLTGISNDKSYDIELVAKNPSNLLSTTASASINATRANAPNVTALPATKVLTVGQSTFNLSVTASAVASEALTYRWFNSTDSTTVLSTSSTLALTGPITNSATGTYYVIVTATINATTATTTSTNEVVSVNAAPKINRAVSVTGATKGGAYSFSVPTQYGVSPYTYLLADGSSLPAGLTLSSAGLISGTVGSDAITSTATIKITDANSVLSSETATVTVYTGMTITSLTLGNASRGRSYSESLAATGGLAPYVWTKTGDLPAGLSLSSGGSISGTLASDATSKTFTAIATDANGATINSRLTITITTGIPGTAILTSVSMPSSGSLTVNWSKPTDDTTTAITTYVIVYGSSHGDDEDGDNGEVERGSISYAPSGDGPYSYTFTNLKNGRDYTFSINSKNSVASGPSSNSIKQSPHGTPAAPKSPTMKITSSGYELRWSKPSESGGISNVTYNAQCKLTSDPDSSYSAVDVAGEISGDNGDEHGDPNEKRKNFTGFSTGGEFTIGSFYTCRMQTNTKGTLSTWSSPTSSVKYLKVPQKPSTVTTNTTTKGKVIVTWNRPVAVGSYPLNGGSEITSYVVTNDKPGRESDDDEHGDGNRRSCSLKTSGSGSLEGAGSFTCTIEGTPTKGSFVLAVKAINAVGASILETKTVTILGKTQTLNFPVIDTKTVGDVDFGTGATLDSGLKLRYAATPSSVCTISQSKGLIHLVAPGTCTVTVSQDGRVHDDEGDKKEGHSDSNDAESEYESLPVSGTTRTFTVRAQKPGTPVFTTSSISNAQIVVNWRKSTSGGDPTSYNFQYKIDTTTATWSTLETVTVATATIGTLTNGTSYVVQVRAYNASGYSAWALSPSNYTPRTTPGAPTITSVLTYDETRTATITWTAPASNGGSSITGYTVTATDTATPSITFACSTGGASLNCAIGGLTSKRSYNFVVVARNNLGAGTGSNTVVGRINGLNQTINVITIPPSTGKNVGDADVQIDANTTSGLPVQYKAVNPAGAESNAVCTVNSSGIIHFNSDGECKVTLNQDGEGTSYNSAPAATPVTMTIGKAVPTAPVITDISNGSGGLTVTWSAPSRLGGGTVTDTVSAVIGGTTITCTSIEPTRTCLLAGASPDVSGKLSAGVVYSITVKAANGAGTGPASASRTASWFTVPSVPRTFTVETSTVDGRAVIGRWTNSQYANGSAIIRYEVTATSTSDPSLPSRTCSVSSDVSTSYSCSVMGLRAGATYTLSVVAVNAAGSSTQATVTTVIPGFSQIITVASSATKYFGDSDFTPSVTVSSGRSPQFTASNANCTVDGKTGLIHIVAVGSCDVYVDEAGASDSDETSYKAASRETYSLTILPVVPGKPTISSIAAGDTQLTANWTNPIFTGGLQIDSMTSFARLAVGADVTVKSSCLISASSPQSCALTGLTNGTKYSITVIIYNAAGASVASDPVAGTPTAPASSVPADLSSDGGVREISVTWTPPTAGTNFYRIQYRVAATAGTWTKSSPETFTAENLTITGLLDKTEYEIQVQSDSATVASAWSASSFASTLNKPSVPRSLAVTPGFASNLPTLEVSWNSPADDGGSDITGFTVTGATCIPSPATATKCTVSTGLSVSTSYSISVTATNAVGTSSAASTSATTVGTPSAAPVITVVSGQNESGTATITWTGIASGSNGGLTILNYKVTAWTGGAATSLSCVVPSTDSPSTPGTYTCIVPGLNYKTEYKFKANATNMAGAGVTSDLSDSVTLVLAQSISALNLSSASFASSTRTLGSVATSGLPVSFTASPSSVCTLTSETSTALNYVHAGVCTVIANQSGAASRYSAAATVTESFTVTADAPDALTLLQLSPGASKLNATWSAATQLGGSTITGYVISYAKDPSFSDENTLSSSDTTTAIINLNANTSYRVRVKIVTVDYPDGSPWSNVLTAKTFGLPNAAIITSTTSPAPGSVIVTWTDSTDNGGTSLLGYTVTVYTVDGTLVDGKSCTAAPSLSSTSRCTVLGLSGATYYKFKVASTNAVGSTLSALYPTGGIRPGASQTITAASVTKPHSLKTFVLDASTTSGLPLTYAVTSSTISDNSVAGWYGSRTVCTVDGSTGLVTIDLAGTCTLSVSQDGKDSSGLATAYFDTSISIVVTVTATQATLIRSVVIDPLSNGLIISWLEPEDDGGTRVSNYRISWYKTSRGSAPSEAEFDVSKSVTTNWKDYGRTELSSDISPLSYTTPSQLVNGLEYTLAIVAKTLFGYGASS